MITRQQAREIFWHYIGKAMKQTTVIDGSRYKKKSIYMNGSTYKMHEYYLAKTITKLADGSKGIWLCGLDKEYGGFMDFGEQEKA